MQRMLAVGYGNTLRRDDGAGPRAVEGVARRYPEIDTRIVHELQPELAEIMSRYQSVVFIDAAAEARTVTARVLNPTGGGSLLAASHGHSPETLLSLCAALYHRVPERTIVVGIPAADFSFGDTLSPQTAQGVDECVELVGRLRES